jgi:hypothetical protein
LTVFNLENFLVVVVLLSFYMILMIYFLTFMKKFTSVFFNMLHPQQIEDQDSQSKIQKGLIFLNDPDVQ